MKLFFKHIFRSIRKSPLQPILICLTVALAVAVAVTSLRVSEMFADHARQSAYREQAVGDVLISMRGDSDVRLLFDEDARALLGDDGSVLGEFRLSAFLTGREQSSLLTVSAVDLEAADAFYTFDFLQYGSFTTVNLDRAAVISASCAEAHGLSLGDVIVLRVLDTEMAYTVEAIAADTGLLLESDILIDISGVTGMLAERVPAMASLGHSFAPYSRLMIRVNEGVDVSEIVNRFANSAHFSDKTVAQTAGTARTDFTILLQSVFVWIFALLLLLLAGFAIGSALKLLHNHRSSEYALFCNAGASPGQIRALMLAESLCYAALGGLGGVLLATPMLSGVCSLYAWQKGPITVGVFGVFFGILFAFALMLICTLLHLQHHPAFGTVEALRQADAGKERLALWDWLSPLGVIAIGGLLMLILPVSTWLFVGMPMLVAIIWLIFTVSPFLIGQAARLVEKIGGRHAFLLPIKNVRNRFAIRHAGRLLAVVFSVIFTLLVCIGAFDRQLASMTTNFSSDMVAVNVSEQGKATIAADPDVAGIMELSYFVGCSLGETAESVTAVSASGDVALCADTATLPKLLPVGKEIAVSKGLAALVGARVGDWIPLTVQGISHELMVTEILPINANFVYLDAHALGLSHQMLCIRFADGAVDDMAVSARLLAVLEAEGASSLALEQVFDEMPAMFDGHLQLLRWGAVAAAVLSIVACANVLMQQYRERKTEREVLRVCGMERGRMVAMHVMECTFAAIVALAIAVLSSGAICLLIDLCIRSFGMVLFA